MKRYKHRILPVLGTAVLLMLTACGNGEAAPGQTAENIGEMTAETETFVTATAAPEITAPQELSNFLEESGLALRELSDLGCMQLVTVDTEGASANIELYVLEDGQWQACLSCADHVGRNGAVAEKREGDKATPKGLYPVGEAFYITDMPQTALDAFQITPDTYWVDDPASRFYNQRVEGAENKDWNSAEQMARYSKSYEYGFVIGYNTEGTPNAGSAIFFHVGDGPTAGCVAADREAVLQLLAVLDEAKGPYILIN